MTDEQRQEIMRRYNEGMRPMNEALMALPPMVEVARTRRPDELRITYAYTAEHMRSYAAEQVAAERERCATICEEHAADQNPTLKNYEDTYRNGWLDASNECGWAIRVPSPNAYDDELWADLKRINDEVQRRTWARPFEPYATWAHCERLAAMGRFESRNAELD